MKEINTLLFSICFICFMPNMLFSQITTLDFGEDTVIGSYKTGLPPQTTIIELKMRVTAEQDTIYSMMYRDAQYSQIIDYKTIYFDNRQTLLDFKDIVLSVFKEENRRNRDYIVRFTLTNLRGGQELVSVSTHRSMGITTAMVQVQGKGYIAEVERNWRRVFEGLNP